MNTSYIETSRRYGSVYVHADNRKDTYGKINGREVVLSCSSYGQSLQNGGHKYKAYAHFTDTWKPVPSKLLNSFVED